MPYEADPEVLAWFDRTLHDSRANVRRRAVELLEKVDCAPRDEWLAEAERDSDARVAGTAVLVRTSLDVPGDGAVFELLESDFADGVRAGDLEWEWEYVVTVCEETHVPLSSRLVFLKEEDDQAAKRIAAMMTWAGRGDPGRLTPLIVAKHLVNKYTRSPRSMVEAMTWKSEGRPRYREGGGS